MLDEGFHLVDDDINIEEFSAFEGCSVAQAVPFDVKTVFEGVEVAGLATFFSFHGFVGRNID